MVLKSYGWLVKRHIQEKYSGLYCVGCEEYYKEDDLIDGLCPEHKVAPELIEEENYFLSYLIIKKK